MGADQFIQPSEEVTVVQVTGPYPKGRDCDLCFERHSPRAKFIMEIRDVDTTLYICRKCLQTIITIIDEGALLLEGT